MSPDDPRHGTPNGYKIHSRTGVPHCDPCRHAHMVQMKLWKMGLTPHLVDPTGTHRRIRALMALGWTMQEIGARCGHPNRSWAGELLKSATVHEHTAARIADAYESMSMVVPIGKLRGRTRALAQRKGWHPPLAWDDIDDPNETPAAAYKPAKQRPGAELLAEFEHLSALGESIHQAARSLGVTVDAIEKAMTRRGEVA